MKILRYGFIAGLIGFVVMVLIELLGILPALYCLKGIIQPLIWLCVGWLTGYFISVKEDSLKWNIVIPASLLAGFITAAGSILSQLTLQAYLASISRVRIGDTMFPSGLDPISEKWWISLLAAMIISVIGGSIAMLIGKSTKLKTITDNNVITKKNTFAWIGFLIGAVTGGLVLTGLVMLLYNTFAGDPSGNLSNWASSEFISFMWPYTVTVGIVAGSFTYTGIYFLRSSSTISRRILSILTLSIGIIIWIAACLALALFIITFDMM